MGQGKLYFSGHSKHIVQGRLSKDAPHTLFRKYHAALLIAMPIIFFVCFLIGINDSLGRDTPCFPLAVGFYFEIAFVLISASLHPPARLSPCTFVLLVPALPPPHLLNSGVKTPWGPPTSVTAGPGGRHPPGDTAEELQFALQKPPGRGGGGRPCPVTQILLGHVGSARRAPTPLRGGPILALGQTF